MAESKINSFSFTFSLELNYKLNLNDVGKKYRDVAYWVNLFFFFSHIKFRKSDETPKSSDESS